MTSTFLGYEFYARDLPKSLQRVASEPVNKRDKDYYDANIGKVTSIDDFVGNYRLFSYAMKAFGMDDLTYAKGLIKKVLASDLSDPTSLANRLTDPRFKTLAQNFGFATNGTVAKTSIQSAAQQDATAALFATKTTGLDPDTEKAATTYYKANIGAITSFAALAKDQKLYSYVLTAYGVDPTAPQATLAALAESSLADPKSAVNATTGAGYLAMHDAFNVGATGLATVPMPAAQTKKAIAATVQAYAATIASTTAAQTAAKAETTYYGSTITDITSVDGLLSDTRLKAYVIKAFNLPAGTDDLTLRSILTSDTSDPTSVANRSANPAYKDMAAAFGFAADGTLKAVPLLQTADQRQSTVGLYEARQTADTPEAATATAYYEAHIGAVGSVADLEKDQQLYNYVLAAYGVDPATSQADVENVLEAGTGTTTSVIEQTPLANGLAFAQAFNVDANGNATDALQAQGGDSLIAATKAYLRLAKTDTASQAAARTETNYYKAAIATVTSVSDLLADPRLVAYVKTAYGLPASTTASQLRSTMTSDPTAAKSAATKLGGNYPAVAAAFNFSATGLPGHQTVQRAQTRFQIGVTDAGYTQQSLETEAGNQNPGIKLALYLRDKGPNITNPYDILADKALTQVFQTILGVTTFGTKADIDVQGKFISSRINYTDLRDPKKLETLVQRFAALYDIANPDSTSSNAIALLFGSNADSTTSNTSSITVPTV